MDAFNFFNLYLNLLSIFCWIWNILNFIYFLIEMPFWGRNCLFYEFLMNVVIDYKKKKIEIWCSSHLDLPCTYFVQCFSYIWAVVFIRNSRITKQITTQIEQNFLLFINMISFITFVKICGLGWDKIAAICRY